MAADTYSSIIGYLIQATGNNNNNWGDKFNNSVAAIFERSIAGKATHPETGGALDLSTTTPPAGASTAIDLIHDFTGTLTSNLTVTVPNLQKTWIFRNQTSGAYQLFVKTAGGSSCHIPQGTTKIIWCDGNNVITRHDDDTIGDLVHTAKATVGAGTLQCNGASLLRTDFPNLFAKIGTTWGAVDGTHFTLPDYVTNNRFLRAAGGSLAVATTQSNQNAAHTHSITGIPGLGTLAVDSGGAHSHTANVTDSGHSHGGVAQVSPNTSGNYTAIGGTSNVYIGGMSGSTSSATTGISVSIVSGGAHTHTVSGALTAGTLGTASQGGTEARPENAAVLICIRY